MAVEETIRLLVKTEMQNALKELSELKEGIQQTATATDKMQASLGGVEAFEEAFQKFKEEAARAKEVQESFNAALEKTPDDENLKNFGKSMRYIEDGKPAVDGLTQGFGELVEALGLLMVAQQALNFGKELMSAWSAQEQAVQKLNASLRVHNRALEASNLQEFASSLQKATGVGDELTLSLLGSYAAIGRTEEELKAMATAAADLAAGSGMSLDQAMKNLNSTLGGQVGELGEIIPQVRMLTQEQLQNGEAIKLIADLYKGQAAAALGTLQGKINALSGEFGDMQEALFESFAPLVKGLVDGLRTVVGFITGLPEPVRTFAVALGALAVAGIGVVGAMTAFNLLKPALMASLAQLTGGATTFWGAMMGPVGWAALIIVGLAAIATAIISTTDTATEQTRKYAAAMQETTDRAEKLKMTQDRIREVERALAEDRRQLESKSRLAQISSPLNARIRERQEELRALQGILSTVQDDIRKAASIAQTQEIVATGRAREEGFVREAAERLIFLDRYKTDLQQKQSEIAEIDEKIRKAQAAAQGSASQAIAAQAERDLVTLRGIRDRAVAELAQMRREANLSEFDRMYADYLQSVATLNRKAVVLGWDEAHRAAEVRKLAAQFAESASEISSLTETQKNTIREALSLSITPTLELDPFTEAFGKWQEAQAAAIKMRESWDHAMANARTEEERKKLEEYGRSLNFVADEMEKVANEMENLTKLRDEVRGLLSNAFGDMGVMGGSILSRLLSEDDLTRLKEHLKEFGEAYGATYQEISRTVGMFFEQMQDMQIANMEAELERLEEQLSAHDAYVDDQMATREEAGKSTVDFEINAAKEREEIAKNLAKKKAEIERAEFQNKQAAASGEAAINTAVAMTKVIPNPFLMALVLGAGALQQALIWSQKAPEVPAFYDGGYFPGSASGTFGRFGEGHQAELVLPLRKEKLQELGLVGGGNHININVYGSDPRQTALLVVDEMERLKREGYLN